MDLEGPSWNKLTFNVQKHCEYANWNPKVTLKSVLDVNCIHDVHLYLFSLSPSHPQGHGNLLTLGFLVLMVGGWVSVSSLLLCSRSKMSKSSLMGVPLGGRDRWWTMRWVGCFCMISSSSLTLTQIDFLNFPQTPDAAIFRIISYFWSPLSLRRCIFLQTTNTNNFLCAAKCCYIVEPLRMISLKGIY